MSSHPQDEVQHHSLTDPESFWAEQASHLEWHKNPTSTLTRVKKSLKSGVDHDHWEWFQGGEISTCYNCVDRHVLAGNGDNTAIIWDSPVTKTKRKYTYKQLLSEVETFAGVLREQGVNKGDVVLIYSEYLVRAFCCIRAQFCGSLACEKNRNLELIYNSCSAYDTCCSHWSSSHFSTGCYPRSGLRWFCPRITGSTHRSFEARRRTHSFLWNRWS